jgi:hypothetical protein
MVDKPEKGHWPKGRSRNLDPHQLAQARTLVEALKRAITEGWRHPILGVLSLRVVATHLKLNHKTIHGWVQLKRWPPAWALDELRLLLKDFR